MSNEDSNWLTHLKECKLSDVLLKPDNFHSYSELVDYIQGYKIRPKMYNHIYAIYDKELSVLDIFDEQVTSDKKVPIKNITMLLFNAFRYKDIRNINRDEVLSIIDNKFQEVVNKL